MNWLLENINNSTKGRGEVLGQTRVAGALEGVSKSEVATNSSNSITSQYFPLHPSNYYTKTLPLDETKCFFCSPPASGGGVLSGVLFDIGLRWRGPFLLFL